MGQGCRAITLARTGINVKPDNVQANSEAVGCRVFQIRELLDYQHRYQGDRKILKVGQVTHYDPH